MRKDLCLLGIDPGRYKFGWAFGTFGEGLLCSGIGETASFALWLARVLEEKEYSFLRETLREGDPEYGALLQKKRIFLGTGTGSRDFARIFEDLGCPFVWGEESFTTLEARKVYWELHPPRGIKRLLPRGLLLPPRPLDDLAAWCIVKKCLNF